MGQQILALLPPSEWMRPISQCAPEEISQRWLGNMSSADFFAHLQAKERAFRIARRDDAS